MFERSIQPQEAYAIHWIRPVPHVHVPHNNRETLLLSIPNARTPTAKNFLQPMGLFTMLT